MNDMKIGVVLVTYNRLEKLKHALGCYSAQTYKPAYLLAIDNCSDDGTAEYLEEWVNTPEDFEKKLVHLPENTGGAGGFYEGMNIAMGMDADWIWVSDDDAYPRESAFAELNAFYRKLKPEKLDGISAICSAVYNGGVPHLGHRNYLEVSKWKVKMIESSAEDYEKPYFRFDILSYVGSCIHKSTLEKVGLDEKDYFIYRDDQEHSIRLRKAGVMFCVTSSIVDHDTPPFDEDLVNWGKFYFKRNDFLMIKKNFPYRYFLIRFFKRYIEDVSFLSKRKPELKKMYKEAYRDAWKGKKGLHSLYRPGWKPEEN